MDLFDWDDKARATMAEDLRKHVLEWLDSYDYGPMVCSADVAGAVAHDVEQAFKMRLDDIYQNGFPVLSEAK